MKVVGGPDSKGQTAEKLKPLEARIARNTKKAVQKVKPSKPVRPRRPKSVSRLPAIDIHVAIDLQRQMRGT